VSYVAGDPVTENLGRFLAFHLVTALGYDLPRAIVTAALCLVAGGPVLRVLRRAVRRAAFAAPIAFEPAPAGSADVGEARR
jgi:energy-coupling factor transport system substrate-specific component